MILFWKFKNGLFSKIGRKEKASSVSSNFDRIKYWRRELFDNNLFFFFNILVVSCAAFLLVLPALLCSQVYFKTTHSGINSTVSPRLLELLTKFRLV